MNSNQDQQDEEEQNVNGMTDQEKDDKSNIMFQEMKITKQMEQFGLNEGGNKLLVEKIRQTQKSVRAMVELQYENYEAHIPQSKEKAPNPQLLKLREEEQLIKQRHRESYERLGKAMKNFHIELEKRCKPKTEQIQSTIQKQENADYVNKLMDQGLTYQETIGTMFMHELEKNKAELKTSTQEFSAMAQMYRNMSRKVKQSKQTVNELIEAKKIIDKNQQLL